MTHLKIGSLDIETYGACERNHLGHALPQQTVFQPHRAIKTDYVSPEDLILSAALTFPRTDPRTYDAHGGWTREDLCSLEVGESMVFHMWEPNHRRVLRTWLERLDTIIGMNLPFDISFLRYLPEFRFALDPRRVTLIDLSVLNYLHDETRPEKSLKALSPILGTFSYKYEHTPKHRRFPNPLWIGLEGEGLLPYNTQDTHNTLANIIELANWIHRDWQHTDKLSAHCIRDFSNRLWTSILMSEAGISMNRAGLVPFEQEQLRLIADAADQALEIHELVLGGEGSQLSKDAFLVSALDAADGYSVTHPVSESPLLELTPKQKKVSFKDANRNLIQAALPPNHPLQSAFELINQHQHAQKLVGSYCYPLLRHQRKKYQDRSSCLLPYPGFLPPSCDLSALIASTTSPSAAATPSTSSSTSSNSSSTSTPPSTSSPNGSTFTRPSPPPTVPTQVRDWRVHPIWYATPGPQKDASGAEGGTIQGRMTAKGPAVQTFPPALDAFLSSRYGFHGRILSLDLSQEELRVAALLSGDEYLLSTYQRGGDLHSERAIQIWGSSITEREDFREIFRDCGKHVNFGDLFLAGPETLQSTVLRKTGQHHGLALFEQIVASRPTQRPGLTRWQHSEIDFAFTNGHCRPLPFTGQTRWVRRSRGSKDPRSEIVNFPIQTTAGNVLLAIQAFLIPHLAFDSPHSHRVCMIMNRYDAVYFDTHVDEIPWLTSLLRIALEEVIGPGGYWHLLEQHYGRVVPLEYETHIALPSLPGVPQ